MYEYAKIVLDFIAVASIWAGCLVLYRRLRTPSSLILLVCVSALIVVSTVGVWALGLHSSRPFVDDWIHSVALVFSESLLGAQFVLLVVSSVAFFVASHSVQRPN